MTDKRAERYGDLLRKKHLEGGLSSEEMAEYVRLSKEFWDDVYRRIDEKNRREDE